MSVLKKDIPIYILYECQWRSLHSVKFPLVLWPSLINSDEKLFSTWLSTYCLGVFCLSWNSNWAKLIKLIVALKILLHNLLCTKIWKWAQEPYLSINQWSTIFSISMSYMKFLHQFHNWRSGPFNNYKPLFIDCKFSCQLYSGSHFCRSLINFTFPLIKSDLL